MNDLVSTLMEYFEEAKKANYSEAMIRWDLNKIIDEHDRQVEDDLREEIESCFEYDEHYYGGEVLSTIREA